MSTYTPNLIERIEARIGENKRAVKQYKTYDRAVAAGNLAGSAVAVNDFDVEGFPVEYIPVYLPNVECWTVVFRLSAFMSRHKIGGYVGGFADMGFFTV